MAALYNEVRPHTFSAVVGQESVVENLSAQARADKFFNTYVLSGQYGTGKTTIARVLAMAINCSHKDSDGNPCCECESCTSILANSTSDFIEVDGASNTGVDKVRELISESAYVPVALKKKVLIIDEVHMLSNSAFNALLKTLEEPSEHVVFILCTTELRKIPATVLSRSACYTFGRIDRDLIYDHLGKVCTEKGIDFTEEAIRVISRRCDGSMRNALSVLEQVAQGGAVTEDRVSKLLCIPDSEVIINALTLCANGECEELISKLPELTTELVPEMINVISDAMLMKMGALKECEKYSDGIKALSEVSVSTLTELSDCLIHIKDMLRQGYGSQVLLIELLKFSTRTPSLLKRVEELEEALEELKKEGVKVSFNASIDEVKEETETSEEIEREDFFGQKMAEKFGELVCEKLAGRKISKSKAKGDEPGGIVYEAVQLGMGLYELLDTLEGLCYLGKAAEIDDSTYLVLPSETSFEEEEETEEVEAPVCAVEPSFEEVDTVEEVSEISSVVADEEEEVSDDGFSGASDDGNFFFNFFLDGFGSPSSEEDAPIPSSKVESVGNAELNLFEASERDKVFSLALEGCEKEVLENGSVVLKTALPPLYSIVSCCIEVYSLTGVTCTLVKGV